MNHPIGRRDALKAGLAALTAPIAVAHASPPTRGVRAFQIAEPAGLRRFGYPVHTLVPDAADGRHFRLIRDGRVIPAQFRPVQGPGGRTDIALDFIASPGPLESSRYEVHFGMDVEPGPEPNAGLSVARRNARYFVSQGGALTFEVAEDLSGFLRSVGSPRIGYLRDSLGSLSIVGKEATTPGATDSKPASVRSRVTREGPFAVGLRFEWSKPSGVRSTLDLTIPRSKSWVEASWSVEDPANQVIGLGLELPLLIEGSPTLVDFGAGSTVYGQIKGQQRMELLSNQADAASLRPSEPAWVVRQGEGDEPAILAASTPDSKKPAEGWSHVMDSSRCTALAVAGFGRAGVKDRISVGADGTLRCHRSLAGGPAAPPGAAKSLHFWLHFVPMPVQVGAATSPQAILSPLRVEWDRLPG